MTDPRLLERERGYNFASELTLRGYQDTLAGSMCHCFPLPVWLIKYQYQLHLRGCRSRLRAHWTTLRKPPINAGSWISSSSVVKGSGIISSGVKSTSICKGEWHSNLSDSKCDRLAPYGPHIFYMVKTWEKSTVATRGLGEVKPPKDSWNPVYSSPPQKISFPFGSYGCFFKATQALTDGTPHILRSSRSHEPGMGHTAVSCLISPKMQHSWSST